MKQWDQTKSIMYFFFFFYMKQEKAKGTEAKKIVS